jgi:hypothetical protein
MSRQRRRRSNIESETTGGRREETAD